VSLTTFSGIKIALFLMIDGISIAGISVVDVVMGFVRGVLMCDKAL
jgi:hypothetical protein